MRKHTQAQQDPRYEGLNEMLPRGFGRPAFVGYIAGSTGPFPKDRVLDGTPRIVASEGVTRRTQVEVAATGETLDVEYEARGGRH